MVDTSLIVYRSTQDHYDACSEISSYQILFLKCGNGPGTNEA